MPHQNFVGGPLMFNGAYFFSLVGLSNAFTANLIILCVLMGGVLTSFYLVDRVGRRPLLLVGGTLMALFNFAVGGIGLHKITSSLGGLMVACCALWTAAYSISVAPIGTSASARLFPSSLVVVKHRPMLILQAGWPLSSFPLPCSAPKPRVSPRCSSPSTASSS
jgi:hypothetical protein